MNKIKVLIAENFNAIQLARLHAVSAQLEIDQQPARSPEDVEKILDEDVQILCSYHLPRDLSIAQNLKWVHLPSAGVEHVLDHPIMKSDILLTNASGIHAIPMSEYVIGMMINLICRLPQVISLKWGHGWPSDRRFIEQNNQELREKTVGIIGYGSIGREVGRLTSAFGMRVLALKRTPEDRIDHGYWLPGTGDPEGNIPETIFGPENLPDMLPVCDFVIIAAALTSGTRGIFGQNQLQAMKPTAYLINIARGSIIDEDALVTALWKGQIAGAALDVFSQEPLPSDHPLWSSPNVILSPHISGGSAAINSRGSDLLAENLRRFLANERLINIVDKETGY